ncbi:MAG TPA: hypothetical protein PLM56_09800 [Cyclobacteriaceae bacterium]|jgi:hypothetical protein|nr:hypothetical protein [Cytophagales bacterium]HMR56109.1 hypothetical protein [Cyclobacteriaceae bacterium]HNT49683.1 hypothetical protein [Cyclobacteriaceae bacterium]HRE67629.1 hypothetical protein [Cyclobacteriaceae bacterium]HRF33782.1 hypothetical protein [Cyclobacteriaceae bacterium]
MAIFLLTLAIFALFFILMSVRLLFIKNGEFRGTCATQSPYLAKEGITCGYCGKTLGEGDTSCGDPEKEKAQAIAEMPEIRKKG